VPVRPEVDRPLTATSVAEDVSAAVIGVDRLDVNGADAAISTHPGLERVEHLGEAPR